jgi:hypothetical protein
MDEELQQERNVFFKRSRKGKVLKLIREKYLRGDIECGYRLGTVVSKVKHTLNDQNCPPSNLWVYV